ncbi:hypothetical protein BDY19DRAFT_914501 [Irpex rosettiformis]|uniref:Uncharacterized protein n=1 Tax=Irpex rosettiformis TaxID=378272 RepID=A0ACB8UKP3_9APHY|nr:hypothetical protein BDY19DRAFT_914501 [Irpex rosettiformis]
MLGNVALNSSGQMPSPAPFKDSLPPLPPSDHFDNTPPPPPSKGPAGNDHQSAQHAYHRPPPIDTSATLSPHAGIQIAPITPISPIGLGPSPAPAVDGQPKKKTNPLTDLVETEKLYVDLLTGIIRKVASAWSRQNLPPPELDKMFRSIESIYKANRALLAKLKDIGTDPSSLKTLGDLLMKWIEDLDAPYTKYAANFCCGYDAWEPVQSNERLRTTLAMFSANNPPPSTEEHPSHPPLWTLDALFILPKHRLKYYRKLYSRLLKSTTPGRSDHKLLSSALDKLDSLLNTLEEKAAIRVDGGSQPLHLGEDEVVIDLRMRDSTLPLPPTQRASDSTRGSSPSISRSSQDTPPTSIGRESTSTMNMPVTDLERRLLTDRTLDIFTMQPKQVRLQITPPGLHYARELRISADVVLNFIPRSTGVEITQELGHIFILTDLLLICERMTPQELARSGPDGADMWLLYPPLAGKHLRISAVEGSDNALSVTILRKEIIVMSCESRPKRDKLIAEFKECIDRAALLQPGKNQPPPPPVPQLPPMVGLPTSPASMHPPRGISGAVSAPSSPPSRALSPSSISSDERGMLPPLQGMARMALSDSGGSPHPQRQGSLNAPQASFPPRSSSAAPAGVGPSFSVGQVLPSGPGQMVPPLSFGPGQVMSGPSSSFGPGQVFPPIAAPPGPPGQVPPRGSSFRPPGPGGPGPSQPGLPMGPAMNMNRSASPYSQPASRPPSDGSSGLRKSSSSVQLSANYSNDLLPPNRLFLGRNDSSASLSSLGSNMTGPQPLLPSATFNIRSTSTNSFVDPSPPSSPVQETAPYTGPTTSSISAQMKCKVFLQEHHAKWKSLGSARLKVYHESPTNIKQLVVEADNSKKNVLISTIVLADGVERVGKTGVAIELSDKGQRTGIVYMIQLRNETSAGGLFESLLAGSDRSGPVRTSA